MKHNSLMVTIYTIQHFFVDLTTVFLITALLLGPSIGMVNHSSVIITYNILAFGGQLPIGLAACMLDKNRQIAALGCLLSCLAYPIALLLPWLSCILAALGNGCFHVGAGSDVLKMNMPKAGLSGAFVSSGALGVWLAYRASGIFTILCPVVMLASSVLLLCIKKDVSAGTAEPEYVKTKSRSFLTAAVILLMITIVIRSFLGTIMNFAWQDAAALSLLSIIAVAGGKLAGGFLGDWFGYKKTAVISLTISLVAFIFAFDVWIAGIIAIFCFNMTMPLTLTAIAGAIRKHHGFAFGLTTFALVIGFLPIVFGAGKLFGVVTAVISVALSMFFMVSAYDLLMRKNKKD